MGQLNQLIEAVVKRVYGSLNRPLKRPDAIPSQCGIQHRLGRLDPLTLHFFAFTDHILFGLGHQHLLLTAHAG